MTKWSPQAAKVADFRGQGASIAHMARRNLPHQGHPSADLD